MEIIHVPTVKQFEDALAKMTATQKKILEHLYYFPDSSATAQALAKALNYSSFSAVNIQIGKIGKVISLATSIMPPHYKGKKGEQPAYFLLVGEYYKDTGWEMWEELRIALENLMIVSLNEESESEILPNEIQKSEQKKLYNEGKITQVYVDRFERNNKSRTLCLNHYGAKCFVCDFHFGSTYGEVANGFIHVHHLNQLADIREEYNVNPIKDLRPLCANCHSVIHMRRPAFTIEELKSMLEKNK